MAFLVGTLLWLPDAVAQSDRPGRNVSAVFGNPGDHWADAMPHGHIGRATRDKKYGYEVDFRGDDGCRVTVFWPRDKIDFRGERPRYRLMKRKVTSGWFWYPDRLTADSLPKVYEWVMEIEGDYQRQADAAIAGAKGFLVVATVGSVAPAPRVPLPPARAGAVGRSSGSAARARPSAAGTSSSAASGARQRTSNVVAELPRSGVQALGNIGSHAPMRANDALRHGLTWLGKGYKEVGPGGSGVFRSADGTRQFRMTKADLAGSHGNIGPHVHFEVLDARGRVIENLHIAIIQ